MTSYPERPASSSKEQQVSLISLASRREARAHTNGLFLRPEQRQRLDWPLEKDNMEMKIRSLTVNKT